MWVMVCTGLPNQGKLEMMGRFVAIVLIASGVLSAFGAAQCAASCMVRQCANHSSRTKPDPSPSGCPHKSTPENRPDGGPQCPERPLMGENWLPSVKPVVFSAEDSVFAVDVLPAFPGPLAAWANIPVLNQPAKLPLHILPAIPLRI